VVLLTGGTDGGNTQVVVDAARGIVAGGWTGPVVYAGNVDARAEVEAALEGLPYVVADNVVPRIGVLAPESARRAVREVFLSHVIGGKHLSSRADFVAMVQGATPDVVLTGVELLAEVAGEVVVVDVGGATTDVHSVVEVDPEEAGLSRQVVATVPVSRTVEGDLGMRWSAASTARAAAEEGLDVPADAVRRAADPAYLPPDPEAARGDEALATAAAVLAMRRHAGRSRVVLTPDGRVVERSGKDLREVGLLVGSGGVLRHGRAGVAERVFAGSVGQVEGGWQLPQHAQVTVDQQYILAAAGLLATHHPEVARRLVGHLAAHTS